MPRWFGSYLGDLGGRGFGIGRHMRSVLCKKKWLFINFLLRRPSKTVQHLICADCPKLPNTYVQIVQNRPTPPMSRPAQHLLRTDRPKPLNIYVQTVPSHPTSTRRPSKTTQHLRADHPKPPNIYAQTVQNILCADHQKPSSKLAVRGSFIYHIRILLLH